MRACITIIAATCLASAGVTSAAPKPYELPRKSSFRPGKVDRNPFWPIGWRKQETNATVAPTAPTPLIIDLPPNHFVVTSILIGTPRMAVLNGREYAEGDTITTAIDGYPTKVKLKKVGDGFVIIEYRGQEHRFDIRLR